MEAAADADCSSQYLEEKYTVAVPLVRPKSLFLEILKKAGATGETFTKKEICGYLKDYIGSRQLYDVENPRVVHCSNDMLGAVFGRESFTIDDVLKLLEENITYAPDTCLKTKTRLVKKPAQVSSTGVSRLKSDNFGGVSQTTSRKPSSSSSHDTQDDSSSEPSVDYVSENSTVILSENSVSSMETKRKRRKKKNKQRKNSCEEKSEAQCSEAKKRKRHCTEPSKQSSPQPGSSRQRGASLSISYGDDGHGDFPCYLHVELDEDDPDMEDNYPQVGSTFSGLDDLWYINEGSLTVELDSEPPFSESDISSVRSGQELLVVCQESDVEFFADYSDTDSNTDDKEYTAADNWFCNDCNLNNPPYQRFCDKCWKLRPGWLPTQSSSFDSEEVHCHTKTGTGPEIKKGDNKTKMGEMDESQWTELNFKLEGKGKEAQGNIEDKYPPEELNDVEVLFNKQEDLDVVDSGIGSWSSQPSSQETKPYRCVAKTDNLQHDTINDYLSASSVLSDSSTFEVRHSFSNSKSKASLSSSSEVQGHDLLKVKYSALDDPCIICLTKPKTASLIHGSSGHQVCCFSCAKRLKRRGKVCPVCRRPIQKVVKNYII